MFMESNGQGVTELSDTKWLCELAFLVDMNNCPSDFNLKLQGHGQLISTLFDNVKAFQWKLELLQGQLKKGDLTNFPACKSRVDDPDTNASQVLRHLRSVKYLELIKKLREEFDHRFSDFRDHGRAFVLFQNPFLCVPAEEPAGCRKGQRPEQHIVTTSSTKDFLHPLYLHFASMLSQWHLYSEAHTSVRRHSPPWPLTNPSWDPGWQMTICMLSFVSQRRRWTRTSEESWPIGNSTTEPIEKRCDLITSLLMTEWWWSFSPPDICW